MFSKGTGHSGWGSNGILKGDEVISGATDYWCTVRR